MTCDTIVGVFHFDLGTEHLSLLLQKTRFAMMPSMFSRSSVRLSISRQAEAPRHSPAITVRPSSAKFSRAAVFSNPTPITVARPTDSIWRPSQIGPAAGGGTLSLRATHYYVAGPLTLLL